MKPVKRYRVYRSFPCKNMSSVKFASQNPSMFAAGTSNKRIHIFILNERSPKVTFLETKKKEINYSFDDVLFNPSEDKLLGATSRESIQIWDCQKKAMEGMIELPRRGNQEVTRVRSMDFRTYGKYFSVGCEWKSGTAMYIYDIRSSKSAPLQKYKNHTSPISTVKFYPDGKYVVTGDQSGLVNIWDIRNGKLLKTLAKKDGNLHKGKVMQVGFHPADLVCCTTSAKVSCFWNLSNFKLLSSRSYGGNSQFSMFDREGTQLLSCLDKSFQVSKWDPKPQLLDTIDIHDKQWVIRDMVMHKSLNRIFSLSYTDEQIYSWTVNLNRLQPYKSLVALQKELAPKPMGEKSKMSLQQHRELLKKSEEEKKRRDNEEEVRKMEEQKRKAQEELRLLNLMQDKEIKREKVEQMRKELEMQKERKLKIEKTNQALEEKMRQLEIEKKEREKSEYIERERIKGIEEAEKLEKLEKEKKERERINKERIESEKLKAEKEKREKEQKEMEEKIKREKREREKVKREKERKDLEKRERERVKREKERKDREKREREKKEKEGREKKKREKLALEKRKAIQKRDFKKPWRLEKKVGFVPLKRDKVLGLSAENFTSHTIKDKTDNEIIDLLGKGHWSISNVLKRRLDTFKLFKRNWLNERKVDALRKLCDSNNVHTMVMVFEILYKNELRSINLSLFKELLQIQIKVLRHKPPKGDYVLKTLPMTLKLIDSFTNIIRSNLREVSEYERIEVSAENRIQKCKEIRVFLLGVGTCSNQLLKEFLKVKKKNKLPDKCKKMLEEINGKISMFH